MWVAGVTSLALVVFVLVWFQPQKLFIDERVDEELPAVSAPATTTEPVADEGSGPPPSPPVTEAPSEPVEVARGVFVSLDHGTSGVARVLELSDGTRFVRLEGLDTSNGPDLYLYVTSNPADGPEGAFDDDYVNLGRLKGNQGDQNYDLPQDADLRQLGTVVIWCDRFDSAFGAADLSLA
jgi:hypothetical protein